MTEPLLETRTEETWARRSIALDEFEVRDNGDGATIEGYASTFDQPYTVHDLFGDFSETITRSAFDRTLKASPSVVLLENHGGRPHASTSAGTLRLAADDHGLHTAAQVNLTRSDSRDLYLALKDGSYREMSFAFRVRQDVWNQDYTERTISEVSLERGDVSVVTYGANPHTTVAARSVEGVDLDELADAYEALKSGDESGVDTLRRAVAAINGLLPEQVAPDTQALLASLEAKRLPA